MNAKIEDWCYRMSDLVLCTKAEYGYRANKVIEKCPYGEQHFCDGTINGTIRNQAKKSKPPCKHFENGRCELM